MFVLTLGESFMQSTDTKVVNELEFSLTPEAEQMMQKVHSDHMAELGMSQEEYSAFLKTHEGWLANLWRPFAPSSPSA